jgi:hypothetical protein
VEVALEGEEGMGPIQMPTTGLCVCVCQCVAGDRRNRRRGREGGCYFRGVRWRDEGLFVSGHQPLANCHVINPRGQGAKITARVTTRPGEAAASANRIELHLFSVFDSALEVAMHSFVEE